MRNASALLLTFAALALHSASAEPVLTGIMELPDGTRFCLVDEEDPDSSEWLRLGDDFGPYNLQQFDADKELLSVRLGEKVIMLSIREAKIEPLEDAHPQEPEPIDPEALKTLPNEQLHVRGLHRVERGETLFAIARSVGLKVHDLLQANPSIDPRLKLGQIIYLRPVHREGQTENPPAPEPEEPSPDRDL